MAEIDDAVAGLGEGAAEALARLLRGTVSMPDDPAEFPPILTAQSAVAFSTGPAKPEGMSPGNWAAWFDAENSQMVFVALNDDGDVLTGTLPMEVSG